MKRYKQFINESVVPGPSEISSARINIDEEEVELFSSEPALQKLISNNKISLLPPEVWYNSGDVETINTLKSYFTNDFEEDKEEDNYMIEDQFESKKETMVRKYNDFINEKKKFDRGKPGPENIRCCSVRVDDGDLIEYKMEYDKLVKDELALIDGNKIWYFRGDKNTKSILKTGNPFADDEED